MMEVNEETFVDLLWPALIRDVRHKEEIGVGSIAEQGQAPILTAWKEDYVARIRNRRFDSKSMPVPDPGGDKLWIDTLSLLSKLNAPKPNYCFGLREEAFTPEERILINNLQQYTILSHPLYHCFFAVDFKTMNGNWGQSTTQCCRAGAAMIHATEQLLKFSSPSNEHPLKDDYLKKEPCMAFTLAVNPLYSELNLHWAEPCGKSTIYHMHNVRVYAMRRREELKNLRHDINCILDWGCVDRKMNIQEILAKIKSKRDPMPESSLLTPSSEGVEKSAADQH